MATAAHTQLRPQTTGRSGPMERLGPILMIILGLLLLTAEIYAPRLFGEPSHAVSP